MHVWCFYATVNYTKVVSLTWLQHKPLSPTLHHLGLHLPPSSTSHTMYMSYMEVELAWMWVCCVCVSVSEREHLQAL